MQINSFNHFRAIAILFIIAGHSFGIVGMEFNTLLAVTIKNIIAGGTSLFVFISGLLFHHVFYKKYHFKTFFLKKCKNVLVPYLILGFMPTVLFVLMKKAEFDGYFLPSGTGIINEYLVPALKYYMTGRFLTAYWYIPFIIVTFALSPLHVKYIEASLSFQLLLIFSFTIAAILAHRPVDNINTFQSVLYFTPVYLIGITVSIHKEMIYENLKGKEIYLLGIVVLMAAVQASLGFEGNYHKRLFEYGGVDLMFFQKIVLCFFFMIWLRRFESLNNRAIHSLAATSFTAFFMHPFILWFLHRLNIDFMFVNSWVVYILFVGAVSVACVLIAKLAKKLSPNYSRYVIGY
ncbi:MAG: acyltransferase [Gammaproteobacteria bacterium]|nr:acyltransferase [Gammaproteobacteria bacterium]